MTNMNRYLVACPAGAGAEDTYATELDGDSDLCLTYLVEEIALWPDGTLLNWWTVEAPDAGAARLMPRSKREASSDVYAIRWTSAI